MQSGSGWLSVGVEPLASTAFFPAFLSAFIRVHPRFQMTDTAVRLDKWLWATRFFKTRALAQQAIKGGRVEINGTKPKASRLVRPGDRLQIGKGELVFEVEVLSVGDQRVSAPLAQAMYRETEASVARREALKADRRERGGEPGDPGRRPDRRQRRAIRNILRGD